MLPSKEQRYRGLMNMFRNTFLDRRGIHLLVLTERNCRGMPASGEVATGKRTDGWILRLF